MENIEKMINCSDPSFGGAMHSCPHCGKLKFVPFRCHSRFCPTCGNKYAMERTTPMSFKLVDVQHRHCVFIIDENLRDFFLNDRSLLDCLFHSVTSVVSRMFFQMNKSKNFTPGFIMVLHTFGRDLKWNPHIHCLISEGGYSDDGLWRHVNTLITLIYVMLSAQPSLTKWSPELVLPSRKPRQSAIRSINMVFTFMPSQTNVTLKRLSSISAGILDGLSSPHPELTNTTAGWSPFITTAMKMTNMSRKQFLQ